MSDEHVDRGTPDPPVVRPVHLCDEAVEIAGTSPEEVFTTAGAWLTEQRRISTGWTVTGAEWFFARRPGEQTMRYGLTLRLDRNDDDGRLPDGTRPTMAERLPWPPGQRRYV